jgi:hypothetical protein
LIEEKLTRPSHKLRRDKKVEMLKYVIGVPESNGDA